jgi:hypothetical protein
MTKLYLTAVAIVLGAYASSIGTVHALLHTAVASVLP